MTDQSSAHVRLMPLEIMEGRPPAKRAPDQRQRFDLRRLVLVGSMMAEHLRCFADDLDECSGPDPDRVERALADTWEHHLSQVRAAAKQCTRCGALDVHLIVGLCYSCRSGGGR